MQKIITVEFAQANNLSRYFTGLPCKRGHIAERNTKNKTCLECSRINAAKRPRPENYKEKHKEYQARYLSNADAKQKRLAQCKKYRERADVKEREKLRLVEYYQREEVKQRRKAWYAARKAAGIKNVVNKENRRTYINKWTAEHRATPHGKAITFMRKSVCRLMVAKNHQKSQDILGYDKQALTAHLEKQFLPRMTWDNYGEWHIDHIIPISMMLKNGITDPAVINALSNLRPMWAVDNLRKGAKQETLL